MNNCDIKKTSKGENYFKNERENEIKFFPQKTDKRIKCAEFY